ncbi:Isochorismatase [uncultured Candidatus Thioglobus sp.]|nr:Isochorismatase [uncultured Candidatus Thioglobus sp.]
MNNHLCSAETSCLLIIDVQTRLTATMQPAILNSLKKNINVLLQAAQKLSLPVLITEQYPAGLGKTEPEIMQQLPTTAISFEKTSFSCVHAEKFMQTLEKITRKQVILMGMEAHICVLQTAVQLVELGYQVFVVSDGICSRKKEHYNIALERMIGANIIVCNTESVLFEWLRDATHQHFKPLVSLLK